MEIPKGPGTYVLLMQLPEAKSVAVGRLGELNFEAGYYLYVGSALAGLRPRLARHMRQEKRRHWHIDYLLDAADLVEIWYAVGRERVECAWAEALRDSSGMTPLHKGFGASDCRCATHLFYASERPTWNQAAERLEKETLECDGCSPLSHGCLRLLS